MIDLDARQIQILRAVIEEFIETAEPVGSDTVDKKFNIGVSPATIRNEMVYLTEHGYLSKAHSSSGRLPTPVALKLYINELMKEQDLSVADEVSIKEKIWKFRRSLDELLYETTRVLADRTHSLSVAMDSDERLYHSGFANLLGMPEFYDINVMRNALRLVEEESLMREIFAHSQSENPVHVVFGLELGNRALEPVSVLYIDLMIGGVACKLGVLGSHRFNYAHLIPTMKYCKGLIEEMAEL